MVASEAMAVNDIFSAPLGNLLGHNQCSVQTNFDHSISHAFNQHPECRVFLVSPFLKAFTFPGLEKEEKRKEGSANIPLGFSFSLRQGFSVLAVMKLTL